MMTHDEALAWAHSIMWTKETWWYSDGWFAIDQGMGVIALAKLTDEWGGVHD